MADYAHSDRSGDSWKDPIIEKLETSRWKLWFPPQVRINWGIVTALLTVGFSFKENWNGIPSTQYINTEGIVGPFPDSLLVQVSQFARFSLTPIHKY